MRTLEWMTRVKLSRKPIDDAGGESRSLASDHSKVHSTPIFFHVMPITHVRDVAD